MRQKEKYAKTDVDALMAELSVLGFYWVDLVFVCKKGSLWAALSWYLSIIQKCVY